LQRLYRHYIILLQAEPEKLHSQPESGNELKSAKILINSQTKPMEANQIIQVFTEVVRNQDYVFSDVSLDAITELQKTIAGIETEPPEVVAEAIRQWYLDYEKVRNAVFLEELEREIGRVPRTRPENEENTVENRYRLLQEEVEKLKEKKTPAQNP
jgi:hypothetical protein